MNKLYSAIFTLVGTIIGAGIFGLPYMAVQTGIVAVVGYLIILTVIVTLLHLLYGEVVLRTNGQHRLVGYAEMYLGVWGKRLASFSVITGTYATLLAYIILSGSFLYKLLGGLLGGSTLVWSLAFFLFLAIGVAGGLKFVSVIEFFLSGLLLLAIAVFLGKGVFLVDGSNFNFSINWPQIFLPYGAILFALSGASIIPDLVGILGRDKALLKKAIVGGTFIPALIYLFFIVVVFGVSGQRTSHEAISGLEQFYGNGIITLGALIGFLAVATSFLAFGTNLKKTFEYDYGFSAELSLVFSLAVPLALFLAGVDNFIKIIGFAGGVAGGIDGILIILMYRKADRGGKGARKPEYDIVTSEPLEYGLLAIFVLGFIHTLFNIAW